MGHPDPPDLPQIRALVHRRDGGRCVCCGGRAALDTFELSHRRPRSAGRLDCPCNLATTHAGCHRTGRSAIHMRPATAAAMGWIISRHDDREPFEVPMWMPGEGMHVLLDCYGGMRPYKQANGPPEG